MLFGVGLSSQSKQNNHAECRDGQVHCFGSDVSIGIVCNAERGSSDSNQGVQQDQEKYELEIADHIAQAEMANAAWIGIIIGLGGMLLIYRTLVETQKAANSASKATDAAWAAVKITQEIAKNELRAYVSIKPKMAMTSPYGIALVVKNVGKTPCFDLRVDGGWTHIPDKKDEIEFIENTHESAILNPGESLSHPVILSFDLPENFTNDAWFRFRVSFSDFQDEVRFVEGAYDLPSGQHPIIIENEFEAIRSVMRAGAKKNDAVGKVGRLRLLNMTSSDQPKHNGD